MRKLKTTFVILFVALPVAAAAQTTRWVVRDADSALVGTVLSATDDPALAKSFASDSPLRVARRVSGKWIVLPMSRSAVWGTKDRVPFLYEDYECRGPALLPAPQKRNEARATVVFDTGVFWPTGPGETRVIRAKGVLVQNPGQCDAMLIEPDLCCTVVEAEEAQFVAEASGAALADLRLRAPFRLEPVATADDK